ncbi:hypothetical protein SERLA73DRAFT_72094 [Serpula lacrymans var. lacrymans S7.3]|uniref:AMP-dependent synthetase/ligase domain-containing protein n=1 Tax=Serpula lacrymans var. lacrymans (strain S7.3) TaxID=936435 RepID=F8PRI6_SERL3|nr:hypothetical protein SERLA73DRAFT_72094 [Serpula lacrymans var. lacrymans S7.3]
MVAAPSLCLLPPPPQTQARSSTTFRPPPLDGSLTFPQMYSWHLEHTPDYRLFVYVREDGSVKTIYWPEAVKAIYTAAHIIGNRIQWISYTSERPVIAILAASDTIPYFITLTSIMCTNYIAFPISPRNSATAIAHLINAVGVKHILVGREQSMLDLIRDTLEILKSQYPSVPAPALSPMLLFEDLFLWTEATANEEISL